MSTACTHSNQIQDVTPSADGCEKCLQMGDRAPITVAEDNKSENRQLVLEEQDPFRLLDLLANYQPVIIEKWLERNKI